MSPSTTWGLEAGVDDNTFLTALRDLLDDWPIPADEQFSGNGTGTKFQAGKLKINDDKYVTIAVNGTPFSIVTSRDNIPINSVFLDYNTGLFQFNASQPPSLGQNNVVILKSRVRWSDSQMTRALYGGLKSLFPDLFKDAVDTSIMMATNQWLYTLPTDFWDPRVMIKKVQLQEIPQNVNQPREISGAYRVGLDQIQIPRSQWFSPGATLWIEYQGPYRSLSELEPQAYDLPLWYAAAQLLGFKEAQSTRTDTQTVASESASKQGGYQQNTGGWFMTQYRQLRQQLSRPMQMAKPISVYER